LGGKKVKSIPVSIPTLGYAEGDVNYLNGKTGKGRKRGRSEPVRQSEHSASLTRQTPPGFRGKRREPRSTSSIAINLENSGKRRANCQKNHVLFLIYKGPLHADIPRAVQWGKKKGGEPEKQPTDHNK